MGTIREVGALSRNAIRYSQVGDRYRVTVFFDKRATGSVCHVSGLVQVDGSAACARVVTIVSIAVTIAQYRREDYITATGIEKNFIVALRIHSGICCHS